MIFKNPIVLVLIPLLLIFLYLIKRNQKKITFLFPSFSFLKLQTVTWRQKFCFIPGFLRVVSLIFFIIALAGPRSFIEETLVKVEGIDIVLAIDSSGSMAGEDFVFKKKRVNRLSIVKRVVNDFIEQRKTDQIGLIAFAGEAYTICPLTTDYSWVKENLERVELGQIKDGTAVGSAIASSLSRLKKSKAKSKVIILLTDGVNNAGKVDPREAAKAARAMSIKIYTIGAGTKGYVPFPGKDLFGRSVYQKVLIDIDEDMLKEIAQITGGKYFRAIDTESLQSVYEEIDKLEQTEIEEVGYFQYKELFNLFLGSALILLLFEMILSNTLFFIIP